MREKNKKIPPIYVWKYPFLNPSAINDFPRDLVSQGVSRAQGQRRTDFIAYINKIKI